MSGAGETTHRSSSPLKRPASELEDDENKDTEMLPLEDSTNGADKSVRNTSSAKRTNNTPPPSSITNMAAEVEKSQQVQQEEMDTDGDEDDLFANAAPATSLPRDEIPETPPPKTSSENARPPIDEQIQKVKELLDEFALATLTPKTRAYIVSQRWLDKVLAHGSDAHAPAAVAEAEIGPVDNSDFIWEVLEDQNGQPFVRLNPDLAPTRFEYFPVKAWDLVVEWYGLKDGQPPISRVAVDTTEDKDGSNVEFELNPVVYRLHRLWSPISPIPIDAVLKARAPAPKIWVASRSDRVQETLKRFKLALSIPLERAVKVWSSPEDVDTMSSGSKSAAPSTSNTTASEAANAIDWSKMLIDAVAFNALDKDTQREPLDIKDRTFEAGGVSNSKATLIMIGLGNDSRLILDELVEDRKHLATWVVKASKGGKVTPPRKADKKSSFVKQRASETDSGRSSPAPVIRKTRGRTSSGRTLGCVGLGNLGNTCYMNSALQCIRSVEELTKYFLVGEAKDELNTENPLGKNGEIAMAYNQLIQEIHKDPPPSSYAPRAFKSIISRYFPNFSGYGQQDSQEFLGLLLDALQEDLNRIKKKPYIEKPDSTDDMVNNPEALRKMAEEVWSITKRRDDSVISDLFTGMYKSTLVCPDCNKVSITFDPFNTVTVQIPIETAWSRCVYFIPLNDTPVQIQVDMDKNGSIKTLKEFVSKRTGVPIERMHVAEEWEHHIYKNYDDMTVASEEIGSSDRVCIFELDMAPTNFPSVKSKTSPKNIRSMLDVDSVDDGEPVAANWDTKSERLLVPVTLRKRTRGYDSNSYQKKPWEFLAIPSFITLTKEEAKSEPAIRRKILQRIQAMTTVDISGQDRQEAEVTDEDVVVTTASDASSGDGKVATRSVDGEDDVVDVQMKEQSFEEPESRNLFNKDARKPAPKWVDPAEYLPAEYDQMFQICYISGKEVGSEDVLKTWQVVSGSKKYRPISDRINRPPQPAKPLPEQEPESVKEDESNAASETSEQSEVTVTEGGVTRMNDESSDEELPSKVLPVRTLAHKQSFVGRRRRWKNLKTYSRKQSKTRETPTVSPHFGGDGASEEKSPMVEKQQPLIRIGEQLVVDWTEEGYHLYDELFADDTVTYNNILLMPDPELDTRKKHRMHKRKQGVALSECLDEFGKEEILSEMDTWYCPRCKEHRRASKKLELWKLPDILVLHFKRFAGGTRSNKLDVLVDFPIEGLDMTKRIVESDGNDVIYDLFAVDNHYGGLGGGHYTAYAKSYIDQQWYDYNDSSVSQVKDPSLMVNPAAYLLFYRRRSITPLGGPRFTEVAEKYRAMEEAPSSDDDDSESGEGRRLGADSSQTGSSSALPGVGRGVVQQGAGTAARQVAGGAGAGAGRVNPNEIEGLPDYQIAINEGAEQTQSMMDAEMNGGIQLRDNDGGSPLWEDDEAIDLGPAFEDSTFDVEGNLVPKASLYASPTANSIPISWDLSNLNTANQTNNSAAGDDSDTFGDANSVANSFAGSDGVEMGSNASSQSIRGRLDDYENAEVDNDYRAPTPPPDIDESGGVSIFDLHEDVLEAKFQRGAFRPLGRGQVGETGAYYGDLPELEVPMDTVGEEEDVAMEIHVEEGEGLGPGKV